jgi:hypothetical protein
MYRAAGKIQKVSCLEIDHLRWRPDFLLLKVATREERKLVIITAFRMQLPHLAALNLSNHDLHVVVMRRESLYSSGVVESAEETDDDAWRKG